MLEACAEELDHVLRAAAAEPITLVLAARESGYSAAHLRWLVAQGRLQDVAVTGRVRRGALPRKPGYRPLHSA
jgi:hypothetical protein